MKHLADWIRRHQVIAFFVITFAITWGLGFAYLLHLSATMTLVWFYNRSKGSILVAGIAHAAANTAFAFILNLDATIYNWVALAAALGFILIDRMWKKLPSDHPAVHQTPALGG